MERRNGVIVLMLIAVSVMTLNSGRQYVNFTLFCLCPILFMSLKVHCGKHWKCCLQGLLC